MKKERLKKDKTRQSHMIKKEATKTAAKIAGTLALMWIAILAGILLPWNEGDGYASSYISEKEFLRQVLNACEVQWKDNESVFDAAYRSGIIKDKREGSGRLTRADAAVILDAAYEKMYGVFDNRELTEAIRKNGRISDLEKTDEEKQEAVLRVYAAGLVPGYKKESFDGAREFRGSKNLTSQAAETYIARLLNEEERVSLSEDGQVLKMGRLPKYAWKYPYILENYPDSYYDWALRFETVRQFQAGEMAEDVYAYPKDMPDLSWFDGRLGKPYAEYATIWADMVRTYAELAFQVDYRTIDNDDSWFRAMYILDADSTSCGNQAALTERLNRYIQDMKENQTIVELKTAAADPSSLYYFNGSFYIRLYVKYRVMSSRTIRPSQEDILYNRSFNSIIYSDDIELLTDLVIGEWREGYYDIALSSPNGQTDGSDIRISERAIQDEYYQRTAVR